MRDEVAAAAAAWDWYPDDARVVENEDFRLVVFAEWSGYLKVTRFTPAGDPAVAATALLDAARATGRPEVEWWVKPDEPRSVDELVLGLGGRPSTTLDLLAADLRGGRPTLDVPADVEVREVAGRDGLDDFNRLTHAVFDEPPSPDDDLDVIRARVGRLFVAHVDDEPVGTAALTLVDGVARLWGGGVLEPWRRRGVYRALLADRLDRAVAAGAHLALVRGRVDTSAPILRAAGFSVFGQERGYAVAVAADSP